MDSLNLEPVETHELQESFAIIKACSDKLLNDSNLDHWSSYYNDLETYKHKIEDHNSEVFVIHIDSKPAATVTISSNPPDYYVNPEFGPYTGTGFMKFFTKVNPENSAIYISALGVHPDFQGKGLAKLILKRIEELAKFRGIKAIRFDTRTEFNPAVSLYESMGYKKVFVDEVSSEENYNYYEKLIS